MKKGNSHAKARTNFGGGLGGFKKLKGGKINKKPIEINCDREALEKR